MPLLLGLIPVETLEVGGDIKLLDLLQFIIKIVSNRAELEHGTTVVELIVSLSRTSDHTGDISIEDT